MPENSPPRKVRCTVVGCNGTFSSVKEMVKHKIISPTHDYCSKCDEDFVDEERLLIHKIYSERHIVCPICGVEFKSERGCESHIRQNHRTEQTIECHGCKSIFKTASSLMRHIEDNECSHISNIRLLREQSKKLFIKEALNAGKGENLPVVPDPKDFDDIDGGVKLDPAQLNRQAMMNQPKLGEDDPTASISSFLALKHWPRFGEQGRPVDEGDDLMKLSPNSNRVWKGKGRANPPGSANPPESDEQQEVAQPGPFGINFLPDAGQTLRMLDEHWDSTKFFNSFNGRYICPGCSAGFPAMKEFEEHILSKSRGKREMQCPGCFRKFKSTAALIAHCEASKTRCSVNETVLYGQIIDELSGGVIQTNGYHEDGTVKYEAGKLETQQTTTIGRAAHKTVW